MNAPTQRPAVAFAAAAPAQRPEMIRLLTAAGLPVDDIGTTDLSAFELALDAGGRIVGMAGLEVLGAAALLRSLAVVPDMRGRGLGEQLIARREAAARIAGVETIWLLTSSADAFFRHLGYADWPRDAVPAAIAAHAQYRSLCPASAKCLAKDLS